MTSAADHNVAPEAAVAQRNWVPGPRSLPIAFSYSVFNYLNVANPASASLAEQLGGTLDLKAAVPGNLSCLTYRHNFANQQVTP